MATDFFERQSRARTNTTWLIALFIIAVIAIVVLAIGVSVAVLLWYGDTDAMGRPQPFRWEIPVGVGAITLAVIAGGSIFKILALRHGGGSGVAEGLGGNRLYPNATGAEHRQLMNVVEEMAIASGTPVPPVFLLDDEEGINAFAAGYSPGDAVIGITRGCAESLTRDQLQGVVAHEFSHILNGDMRIGIRLIGVLHGILLLGLLGHGMLRMVAFGGTGRHRRSRSSNKKGGGNAVLLLLALAVALIVIGSVGAFIGGLIKAAVSRQREFLADASAVQFTRNPRGLSGALQRIGAIVHGSRLQHPRAPEASHLYFAQGVSEGFTRLMSTHPPLSERIRAIDPSWDGAFPRVEPAPEHRPAAASPAASPAAVSSLAGPLASASGVAGQAVIAAAVESENRSLPADASLPAEIVRRSLDRIGSPAEEHYRYATELLAQIPDALLSAIREPYEARTVVFALLLDSDSTMREPQIASLRESLGTDVVQRTERWFDAIGQLESRVRLPLIDLSLPALRTMTPHQYRDFDRSLQMLIAADASMDLFEWTLSQVLMRHLRSQFEPLPSPRFDYYALGRLGEPCGVLLSMLAHIGHAEPESKKAFALGAQLIAEAKPRWLPKSECTLTRLDAAVRKLATVTAKHRERIVDSCAVCVCADGHVTAIEAEMLRGIADLLDCPMPPYLGPRPSREMREE